MIQVAIQSASGQVDPKLQNMMDGVQRELTRAERKAVRKLVKGGCANYCNEYGCLQLNGDCYMLMKCWTGAYCKHFRNAVLPLDPILEDKLTGSGVETRDCAVCGEVFAVGNRKTYCSDACAGEAKKRQQRGYMRYRRGSC